MRGSPSTQSAAVRWNSLASGHHLRMLLISLLVGVLAGLLAAHLKLHLRMPGHLALLWMTPIVAGRLLTRHPVGGSAGACAAAFTSLAFGGRLAGGPAWLPLVGVAGVVIDLAAAFIANHHLKIWLAVPIMGLAGVGGNLVCAIKRLLAAQYHSHLLLGLSGPAASIVSYAIFGLLAGVTGAILAALARGAWRGLERDRS